MAIIVSGNTGGDFQPAPPGLHQAVCCDVVDLGEQETAFGIKRQVRIIWQIKTKNQKGERFQVRQTYTASLNEKSNLRRDLESWRGRPFTPKEIAAFDVEAVLGANCQLQVVQQISKKGRTYANVKAVVPLGHGMGKMDVENYEREKYTPPEDRSEPLDPNEGYIVDDGDSCPF